MGRKPFMRPNISVQIRLQDDNYRLLQKVVGGEQNAFINAAIREKLSRVEGHNAEMYLLIEELSRLTQERDAFNVSLDEKRLEYNVVADRRIARVSAAIDAIKKNKTEEKP